MSKRVYGIIAAVCGVIVAAILAGFMWITPAEAMTMTGLAAHLH